MSAHTKTPWTVSPARTVEDTAMIVGGEGFEFGLIADVIQDADAAFIVKACNSHEALVKALTDARAAIASLPMETLGYASDPGGAQIHWPIRDELLHRIDTALNAEPPVNGVVATAGVSK